MPGRSSCSRRTIEASIAVRRLAACETSSVRKLWTGPTCRPSRSTDPTTMARPEPAERAQGNAPWPLDGPIERSPWRGVAAVGAVGEAVAHIPVIQMHLTEAPYLGGAFVLLTVAGFLLGLLLLTADTPRVWLVPGAIAAMALAGYVISRTIGLPEITDDIGNWTEPLGLVAIGAERSEERRVGKECRSRWSPYH